MTSRWSWSFVLALSVTGAALTYSTWLGNGLIPKLQAFGLWMLLVPLGASLVALLRRRWVLGAVLLGCLLLGAAPILKPPSLPTTQTVSGDALTVLSFNALKAGADPNQLAESIEEADPDVLVLVETSEELHAELAHRGVMQSLLHRTAQAPAGGERDTVIFSRYPLTERSAELSAAATGWYSLPVADVQAPQGPVTVAGIHIYPPLNDADRWSQGIAALAEWSQQQQQHLAPVIMAGDFNSVRSHPQYRKVAAGFTESAGRWPNPSWPEDKPVPSMIEIDHILVKNAAALGFETRRIGGSDHRALIVELRLNP